MNFFKSAIFSFFFNNVFKAKMFTNEIEDVREAPSGGGRYPCAPLEMQPPWPPQEREASSNFYQTVNLNIQIFYFSYQSAMSLLVHKMIISQILSCTLSIIYNIFFARFHLKSWSDD